MRSAPLKVTVTVLGLVASAVACGAPSDPENADVAISQKGESPKIIGGTPSTAAQDATIFLNLKDSFCTGSLIAPNLVLTARHCVSELAGNDDCQHFTTDDAVADMGVVLGVDASESQTPTIAAHATKLYYETNPSGCSYDIALIKLDQDIPGASIAKIRFTQVTTSDVGTAIGYGDGDDKGNMTNGRYQRTGIAVTAVGATTATYTTTKGKALSVDVSPGEFMTGESTCFGDSGGPLLDAAGYIIGVTSRGIDDLCTDRPTIWSDVYSHLTLIQNAATDAGHPITPESEPVDAGGGDDGGSTSSSSSSSTSSSGTLGTGTDAGTGTGDGDTTTTTSGCRAAPSSRASGGGMMAAMVGVALAIGARRRRRG